MDEVNEIHKIRPSLGVDEVRFGMSVDQLSILGYKEKIDRYNEVNQWRTFIRDEDLVLYVKDDVVISYACFGSCYLAEENLIGLSESELIGVLGRPTEVGNPIWVSNEDQQIPFEYEKEGLQIWFEGGKTVSVFGDEGV